MSAQNGDQAAAAFAFELGVLKRLDRTGWLHLGVRDPESVSEHSLRSAQLAALIAAEEDGDPARASYLATWHDSQETRVGDISHLGRRYIEAAPNEKITEDQVAGLPASMAETIRQAVAEFEAEETLEAKCAKDADRLECLIQALEYRAAGYGPIDSWLNSSRSRLHTGTAARIADAALEISPMDWRD